MTSEVIIAETYIIDNTSFVLSAGVSFMIAALIVMIVHFLFDKEEPKSVRISTFILSLLSILITFYQIA